MGSKRLKLAVLGLVIVLGLLLRMVPLSYSHFWDETVYLQDAKVISEGRTNYDELDYRPPVISILYAAGFRVWNNIYCANIVQGLASTIVIPFAFLFTASCCSEAAALVAAVLFAFCPYIVDVSHELMSDAPAVSFMMASLYFFAGSSPASFLLSGVLFAVSSLTRFSSLFLAVYFALWVASSRAKLKGVIPFSAGAFITFLPYWIWAQVKFGFFLSPLLEANRDVSQWDPHNGPAVFFWAVPEIFPAIVLLGAAVAIAVMTAKLARGRAGVSRGRNGGARRAGESLEQRRLLLVWGVLFFAFTLTLNHKETRYILPLAIPMVILAAAGLGDILGWLAGRPLAWRLAGSAALLVMLVLETAPSFGKLAEPWVSQDRTWDVVKVADYVGRIAKQNDRIYALREFPVLAFYSGRDTVSILPIEYDFAQEWRSAMRFPGYFVYFAEPEAAGLEPDKQFLATHKEFSPVKDFGFAVVYRYVPRMSPGPARRQSFGLTMTRAVRSAQPQRIRPAGRPGSGPSRF